MRILQFFLFFILLCSPVSGWANSPYGIQSRNGDFLLELRHVALVNLPAGVVTPVNSPKQGLTISFALVNLSQTRKFDAGGPFTYTLRDEFNNHYSLLNFNTPAADTVAQQQSSFYPGDTITETVTFEPPIAKSKLLVFELTAAEIAPGQPWHLEIPLDVFRPVSAVGEQPSASLEDGMAIAFPPDGGLVRAGEQVLVRVKLASGVDLPDSLLIMSPDYTYEDTTKVMQYAIHIPANQAPGPFPIVVLAKWGEDAVSRIISKTVTLQVLDTTARKTIK